MKTYLFISLISIITNTGGFSPSNAAIKPVNKEKTAQGYIPSPERNKIQGDSILLNKPAPNFELRDLNGKIYSLQALKGKIVVLNFWFIACKPCVNEMSVLNAIKNNYDPAKVVFLALSMDGQNDINAFLQDHKFDYTIIPNASSVAEKYGINAFPVSMVINTAGLIYFIQIGGPDIAENLPAAINTALKNF